MKTIKMLIKKNTSFAKGRLPQNHITTEKGNIAIFDAINLAALLASADIATMSVEETDAYIEHFYDPADPDRIIEPKEQTSEQR